MARYQKITLVSITIALVLLVVSCNKNRYAHNIRLYSEMGDSLIVTDESHDSVEFDIKLFERFKNDTFAVNTELDSISTNKMLIENKYPKLELLPFDQNLYYTNNRIDTLPALVQQDTLVVDSKEVKDSSLYWIVDELRGIRKALEARQDSDSVIADSSLYADTTLVSDTVLQTQLDTLDSISKVFVKKDTLPNIVSADTLVIDTLAQKFDTLDVLNETPVIRDTLIISTTDTVVVIKEVFVPLDTTTSLDSLNARLLDSVNQKSSYVAQLSDSIVNLKNQITELNQKKSLAVLNDTIQTVRIDTVTIVKEVFKSINTGNKSADDINNQLINKLNRKTAEAATLKERNINLQQEISQLKEKSLLVAVGSATAGAITASAIKGKKSHVEKDTVTIIREIATPLNMNDSVAILTDSIARLKNVISYLWQKNQRFEGGDSVVSVTSSINLAPETRIDTVVVTKEVFVPMVSDSQNTDSLNAELVKSLNLKSQEITALTDSIVNLRNQMAEINKQPKENIVIVDKVDAFDTLTFVAQYGRNKLIAENHNQILNDLRALNVSKVKAVHISGYTDSSGSFAVNKQITDKRMSEFLNVLKELNINEAIIYMQNFANQYASQTVVDSERVVVLKVIIEK